MNPTVFYETRRRKVLAACESCWNDATKSDCSGFVKAVFDALGIPVTVSMRGLQANGLHDHFSTNKNDWCSVSRAPPQATVVTLLRLSARMSSVTCAFSAMNRGVVFTV